MTTVYRFSATRISSASAETIFTILDDAPGWARWARPVIAQSRWERWGSGGAGGPGAVRAVGLWPLFIREQIVRTEFARQQTYTVIGPDIFDHYVGEITLSAAGEDDVRVDWTVEFTPRLRILGAPLRRVFQVVVTQLLSRLVKTAEALPGGQPAFTQTEPYLNGGENIP